jgi:hypothetical protein
MAKKRRAYDEEVWRNAKRICRLNARQLEMAKALGMNPYKLPGLRPSRQQRWKLPVGEFIEELYWERFDTDSLWLDPHGLEQDSRKGSPSAQGADTPEGVRDAARQAEDLACYFMNLADDLQQWLEQGTVDTEVLKNVSAELREIVQALDNGAPISPMPAIPTPSRTARPALSEPPHQEPEYDDEIPF